MRPAYITRKYLQVHCLSNILQELFEQLQLFFFFLYFCNENHHKFPGSGGTDNHIAQHPFLSTQIDEGVIMLVSIIAYSITNTIGDVVL